MDYSNKNPWLYAVYVVLVGLPLVLIITFCCSGDKKADKSGFLNLFFYDNFYLIYISYSGCTYMNEVVPQTILSN